MWIVTKTVHEDFPQKEVKCQYLTDMLDAVKHAAINDFTPITINKLHVEDD